MYASLCLDLALSHESFTFVLNNNSRTIILIILYVRIKCVTKQTQIIGVCRVSGINLVMDISLAYTDCLFKIINSDSV